MSQPIHITVGGGGVNDPAIGATQCPILSLAGIDISWISRFGFGEMPSNQWENRPTGGFNLIGGAAAFSDGETLVVHASNDYTVNAGSLGYTNGFNYPKVIPALFGRQGWKQPTESAYAIVTTPNLTSKTGRYFNDYHALCNIRNLKDAWPNAGITAEQFNTELEDMQRAVIMEALTGVFSNPEYIEQSLLFERHGSNDQVIANEGKFCGYRINIAKDFGISVQINSVALYFDTDKTFTLYLFKDGRKTAVWSKSVTAVGGQQTTVDLTELVLSYIDSYAKGDKFYFGYFQDDLGSTKAIREQVNSWRKTRCFGASPFASKKITGQTNFDRDNFSYTGYPSGLNLQMSSFYDHTEPIIKHAHLFDQLIGLKTAAKSIEMQLYSPDRSNATERAIKDASMRMQLQQDLTGIVIVSDGPPKTIGFVQKIEKETERVKKAFFPKLKAQSVSLC